MVVFFFWIESVMGCSVCSLFIISDSLILGISAFHRGACILTSQCFDMPKSSLRALEVIHSIFFFL